MKDLAWVKSLVVEVVKDDGCSVLNADDPLTTRMRRRAEGDLIYFSMQGDGSSPEHLRSHIARGGKAVVLQPGLKGGMLVIYDGETYFALHDAYASDNGHLNGEAAARAASALLKVIAGVSRA